MSEQSSDEDDTKKVDRVKKIKLYGKNSVNNEDSAKRMEEFEEKEPKDDCNQIDIEVVDKRVEESEKSKPQNTKTTLHSSSENQSNKLESKKQKSYTCDVCSKTFVLKHSFQRHMDAHSGQFYPCPVCGARCAQKSNLKRHMAKQNHIGVGVDVDGMLYFFLLFLCEFLK